MTTLAEILEQQTAEGELFEKLDQGRVRCFACAHRCTISDGASGICKMRINRGGSLRVPFGYVSGAQCDPIEKKPLYHFFPGSQVLSIGTFGCNMKCPFCQNFELSRYFDDPEHSEPNPNSSPDEIYRALVQNQKKSSQSLLPAIAYTYSEPVVWFEFVRDCAEIVRNNNGYNILVSNGFINPKPLEELLLVTDAANIDLKAFTEENYQRMGGGLKPVLNTIETLKNAGVWVELTTLVVTRFNDNMPEMENLVKWIESIDRSIPLHFSRYFPQYQYKEKSTDLRFLKEVEEMAKTRLDYVYTGNVAGESHSYCPECRNVLVERTGYEVSITGIRNKKCSKCGRNADFVL